MHGAGYFSPMQIAPALRHALRFVSLSAVVFAIAFAVPSLLGEEIDPRDYIGEDISKYPPYLKQQIERAFLRETGERFTGSQYDPRSPNYAFDRSPQPRLQPIETLDFMDEDFDLKEALIKGSPSYQSAREKFDYSKINKKNSATSIYEDLIIKERKKLEHAEREKELRAV